MTEEEHLVAAFRNWFAAEHGSMVLQAIDAAGFEIICKRPDENGCAPSLVVPFTASEDRDIDREPVLESTKPQFPEGVKT